MVWKSDVPVEKLKGKYSLPSSQFVSLSGMDVHYADEGSVTDSVPVVLLHGTASSLYTWNVWSDSLSKTHRITLLKSKTFLFLILWGKGDLLIPVEFVYRFHEDLPNDTLIVFDKLAMYPWKKALRKAWSLFSGF